jgi:hypothetical protein
MIVPQIVPYPLPLTSPPVLVDFNERRLRVIASKLPGGNPRFHLFVPRSAGDFAVGFETSFSGGRGKPQELVAHRGKTARQETASLWAPGGRHRKGITFMLDCFTSQSVVCSCLSAGPSPRPATSCRRKHMDYIIAGITSLGSSFTCFTRCFVRRSSMSAQRGARSHHRGVYRAARCVVRGV